MNDDEFRQILEWFDFSWSGYRKVRKGVKKRLARHMEQLDCPNVETYLKCLEQKAEHAERGRKVMAVTISRFFRDRGLWRDLLIHGLPRIAERGEDAVRIWSAGCSCGEEAYSIALLWDQFVREYGHVADLEIFATDTNLDVLARAETGLYSYSSLKELDNDLRSRYFTPRESGFWAIDDSLKKNVRWMIHDYVTDDPPGQDFQIVFLRNSLLTYYGTQQQRTTLNRILGSLSDGGFLVIGSHEKIPNSVSELSPCGWNRFVFRKTERGET